MGKDVCHVCQKEIGLGNRFSPEKAWSDIPSDAKLCLEHYNERKGQDKDQGLSSFSVAYSGEGLKVVAVGGLKQDGIWKRIDEIIKEGYDIKGVIEREALHTSWVLLQKRP
jgi:hypothetical protein